MRTLKKKLNRKKGALVEFVPKVLWSYRTTTRTPIRETPFSFTYRTKAAIRAEIGSPSFRVSHYNPKLNDEGIKLHMDLLQERKDKATVNPRKFKVRDWVLRKVSLMTKDPTEAKLAPK
jgi:hypothetical protein